MNGWALWWMCTAARADRVGPSGGLTFFAGAKKVSKESTFEEHAVVGVGIGRCRSDRCHAGSRKALLDRALGCQWSGSTALSLSRVHGSRLGSFRSCQARRLAECGALGSALFFAQRPVEQNFARTPHFTGRSVSDRSLRQPLHAKVLSLPTFFAPAKKVGRLPGRNPACRHASHPRPCALAGPQPHPYQRTSATGRQPPHAGHRGLMWLEARRINRHEEPEHA